MYELLEFRLLGLELLEHLVWRRHVPAEGCPREVVARQRCAKRLFHCWTHTFDLGSHGPHLCAKGWVLVRVQVTKGGICDFVFEKFQPHAVRLWRIDVDRGLGGVSIETGHIRARTQAYGAFRNAYYERGARGTATQLAEFALLRAIGLWRLRLPGRESNDSPTNARANQCGCERGLEVGSGCLGGARLLE
jgi:hypothetical protein